MKQTITICDGCGRQYNSGTREYSIPYADANSVGLYAKTVDLCDFCSVRIGFAFNEIRKENSPDGKGVEHGET